MSDRTQVIAIFGPTGIGKTAVAIALADLLRERGEDPVAISADALQVYRGLETLSGAATPEEQSRLEHRLLGIVPATEAFSVGEFMPLAHAEIDDALAEGRCPIVVGGTGLYLRAALTDLDLYPPPPAAVRARWTEEVERVEEAGASRTARKALGYEELLAGDVDAMKRRTRQYAKRQLTWMRKLAGVKTFDVTGRDAADVAEEINRTLASA